MHIYSAQMTAVGGRQIEAAEFVSRIRDVASEATGLSVSAWATVVGAPYGSFGVAMRVEGLTQLMDATVKLGTNEAWAALADDAARLLIGPAEVGFEQVIATTATEVGNPSIVSMNRAQIAAGQIKAATERSVEMLSFITEVTGVEGMLTMSDAGPTNELTFIFGVDSPEAADAANATLGADPGWLDMMDAAGHLFTSSSSHRLYAARLP